MFLMWLWLYGNMKNYNLDLLHRLILHDFFILKYVQVHACMYIKIQAEVISKVLS